MTGDKAFKQMDGRMRPYDSLVSPDLAVRLHELEKQTVESVSREAQAFHSDQEQQLVLEGVTGSFACLVDAVECGSPILMERYCRDASFAFMARNLGPGQFSLLLDRIGNALTKKLTEAQMELVAWLLEEGRKVCGQPDPGPGRSHLSGPEIRDIFLRSILKGQRLAATQILQEAHHLGHSKAEIYVQFIQESLYEVGRLWESGQASVAQGHVASVTVQGVLADLHHPAGPAGSKASVIMTGVEGERHELGARMVADMLESEGYRVIFLGADLPAEAVLAKLVKVKPDWLGISATTEARLPQVEALVKLVHSTLGQDGPRILLGGAAFRERPELVQQWRVAGYAGDLHAALELLSSSH